MMAQRTHMNPTIGGAINTVKKDIEDILQSGQYYCTDEIAQELCNIVKAMEHIKLDVTLLSTSEEWKDKFQPGLAGTSVSKSVHVLDKLAAYLYDYKNRFNGNSLEGKQENEIRELHQWAVNNLVDLQGELDQHSLKAADRVRQFDDYIGVTDRYTGYRNNLTRGSREPFKLETSYMDSSVRPGAYLKDLPRSYTVIGSGACEFRRPDLKKHDQFGVFFSSEAPPRREFKGYRTIDSLYPRATATFTQRKPPGGVALEDTKVLNAINLQTAREGGYKPQLYRPTPENTLTMRKGPFSLSVQEQAGINTTFPGRTEYMSRFKSPPSDLPTTAFNINPRPNFLIHGRPLATMSHDFNFTEYQSRYEWPDGNRIVKLPWLRK